MSLFTKIIEKLPLRLDRCSLSLASACLWCGTDVFLPVVNTSDWTSMTTSSASTLLQRLERFLCRRGARVDWQLIPFALSSSIAPASRRLLSVLPTLWSSWSSTEAACGTSPGRETSTTFASTGMTFSTLYSSSPLKTDVANSCCESTIHGPSSTFAALWFVGVVTSSTVAQSTFVNVTWLLSAVARHLEASSWSLVTAYIYTHENFNQPITNQPINHSINRSVESLDLVQWWLFLYRMPLHSFKKLMPLGLKAATGFPTCLTI